MSDDKLKAPPHDNIAELSLLGCVFYDNDVIGAISNRIFMEDFYDVRHSILYDAMTHLYANKVPIDPVTLKVELESRQQFETVGKFETLTELMDLVPSPELYESYAEIVLNKSLLRKLIAGSRHIIADAEADADEVEEVLNRAQEKIFEITERKITHQTLDLSGLLEEIFRKLIENKGLDLGLRTPFPLLDDMTGGFKPGQLIIIAARPGMGKTAFALRIAEHIALKEEKPVAYFSLEMSSESLAERLMCSHAGVPKKKLRKGRLSEMDFGRLSHSCDLLGSSKILIDDSSVLGLADLRAKGRRLVFKQGVKAIFVDYLQLMDPGPNSSRESRQDQVSRLSRGLKQLSRELEIPIFCLAQLNREAEKRSSKEPQLADLRESGAIEQDADVVILLFRPSVYMERGDSELTDEEKTKSEIIVAKQRDGATGKVSARFLGEIMRFETPEQQFDEVRASYESSRTQNTSGFPSDAGSHPFFTSGGFDDEDVGF
ncbi:MAG: replicative DNA helicase [Planctomycetes bacterium]|nr:replicative DNA helicase [Planctomycetota bacterium]